VAVTASKLNGGASSTATTTPTFSAQTAGVWLVLLVSSDDYRTTSGANRPESSGWTLQSSGQDEIGAYVWTKVSTGAETSVAYTIGSASPSSWQVVAVVGATGTLVNTPAATHTHGGSTSTSGTATSSSGNGYALACFMAYHSSTSITGGTFTNSYASVGFQLGPTTGNREATQSAGLVTTTAASTSTVISWTGAAPFCSYGSLLIFQEASGATNYNGTATLVGTGSISATRVQGDVASATLAGTGTITATGVVGKAGTATLAGTGAVTATGSVTSGLSGSATLAGTGTITATGVVGKASTATLTGTGAVTATGVVGKVATATLAGTGAITATGTVGTSGAMTGTATLAGTGTITATGVKGLRATAALAGTVGITASGVVGGTGTAIDNPLYLSGRAMF
jgi:hypothetical protein